MQCESQQTKKSYVLILQYLNWRNSGSRGFGRVGSAPRQKTPLPMRLGNFESPPFLHCLPFGSHFIHPAFEFVATRIPFWERLSI